MASQTLGRTSLKAPKPYNFAEANREYVSERRLSEEQCMSGARSRTAIITCVDSRSSPEHFFELQENEAFVIRNGGGRTNDAGCIRSLTIIQAMCDLQEVKVVHHSNCGALFYNDEWVRERVGSNASGGTEHGFKEGAFAWADAMAFLPFSRDGNESGDDDVVKNSIHEDIQFLRDHPLIKAATRVTGGFYNLATGIVEHIDC